MDAIAWCLVTGAWCNNCCWHTLKINTMRQAPGREAAWPCCISGTSLPTATVNVHMTPVHNTVPLLATLPSECTVPAPTNCLQLSRSQRYATGQKAINSAAKAVRALHY